MGAATQAQNMGTYAVKALINGDCGLAAFYMGEMTHYLADLSNFFHVASKKELGTLLEDINYESHVLIRTDGTLYGSSHWTKDNREWYFKVNDGWFNDNIFSSTCGPAHLAIELASQTRFGIDSYSDAKEMLILYEKGNFYHARYWKNRESFDANEAQFMDTVENSLNRAIDYCAAALNWVILKAGFIDCKDINTMSEAIQKSSMTFWLKYMAVGGFIQIMSFLGFWATIYAAPVAFGKN